jgi:hypothetical protein
LSVRSTARKTYGKTVSGKPITDELIDVLARKAEAGYEIEGMPDRTEPLRSAGARLEPMDVAEAKAKLETVLDELAAVGFSVWGWDDGSIQIGQLNGPGAECASRYAVDDPRAR